MTGSSARVLAVNDDPQLLQMARQALGARFECESAEDASTARQKLASGDFDLVLCNMRMPGESERTLAEELAAEHPDTAMILVGTWIERERELEVAEKARRRTLEEQIQAAMDRAPVPIYVKDLERRYLLANRVTHELAGLEPGEMIGRTDAEVLPPEAEALIRESDMRVLRNEEPCEREELFRTGEDERAFLSVKFPYLDGEGKLAGITGVSAEITFQRQAQKLQQELAAAQERLIEELQSSRQETAERLARAIEMHEHDIETGRHVDRIARIAHYLASQLGLDDEQILLLRAAAPMHDVGKIATPEEILRKPGPLTPEERKEIERHTEIGHRVLDGSESELLQMAARIALTHHEWFDGSGYPRGLAGEEIPIEGRIVAVADVFDALLSDRPYRSAMGVEDALDVIREGRGTHFDPEVVDVLLEHYKDALDLPE